MEMAVERSTRNTGYDEKLEHVLRAGALVIAREGYGQATIRQVAREAEMSLAGLYHYFSSKEELLFQIQFHTFDAIVAELERRLERVDDPRQRLRVIVGNHLEHFLARMNDLKVCAHELGSLHGDYFDRVGTLRRRYFGITLDTIESIAAAAGGSQVTPRLATLYLFGMLNWIYMWYPEEDGAGGDELADQMLTLFLDGYLPRAGGPTRNGG